MIEELANKVIIGTKALYQMKIMLNFQNKKLKFGGTSEITQIFYRRENINTDLEIFNVKKGPQRKIYLLEYQRKSEIYYSR
jgi:hypothetical protein